MEKREVISKKFADLDVIMLSIDWEINDEILNNLLDEVKKLEADFEKEKIVKGLLQLHGILGKYILKKKGQTHHQAINLLHSVHRATKKVAFSQSLDGDEKKKIFVKEYLRVKKLQSLLTTDEGVQDQAGEGRTDKAQESIERILPEDIKTFIRDEIRRIIQEEVGSK